MLITKIKYILFALWFKLQRAWLIFIKSLQTVFCPSQQ